MKSRVKRPEYQNGPEAAWRFEHGLNRVLQISKEELERRQAAYQEATKNKARRGPKPKKG